MTIIVSMLYRIDDEYERIDEHIYETFDDDKMVTTDDLTAYDVPVTSGPPYVNTNFTAVDSSPPTEQVETSDDL